MPPNKLLRVLLLLALSQTLHGGLVNLLYDDGERETRVSLSLVRHRGERGHALSGSDSVSDTVSEEGEGGGSSHLEQITI